MYVFDVVSPSLFLVNRDTQCCYSMFLFSSPLLFQKSNVLDSLVFLFRCIFLPDNGAFFVNYVITSAFIGTAAELVRIPELLMYMLKLSMARSAAERTSVRKVGHCLDFVELLILHCGAFQG